MMGWCPRQPQQQRTLDHADAQQANWKATASMAQVRTKIVKVALNKILLAT